MQCACVCRCIPTLPCVLFVVNAEDVCGCSVQGLHCCARVRCSEIGNAQPRFIPSTQGRLHDVMLQAGQRYLGAVSPQVAQVADSPVYWC